MNIGTLLDIEKLSEYIHQGYISARRHPHLPLEVLNYSPKTQYENFWNKETMHCRGLVVDSAGEIVANCMKKFFNYGELNAADINASGPVQVTDKVDGSLLTVAFYKDELVVATRGSFESEQAKFAYDLIRSKYYAAFKTLCEDATAIGEIIYPENRIVVDYGDMRDIILIGLIANDDLRNGRQLWTPADQVYSWPGPVVKRFQANTLEEALKLPPRLNAEGVVIYFENSGERLKIKQNDYVELHKLIFDLTPRRIWTRLGEGDDIRAIAEGLPDEFKRFVEDTSTVLLDNQQSVLLDVDNEYKRVLSTLPAEYSRKEFAEVAKLSKLAPLLFFKLENNEKKLKEATWKLVRPS